MLKKVITGGQTGIDRRTLDIAKVRKFPTGGTAAKRWMTENGPDPSLQEYGLVECDEEGYPARTEKNIIDSHGTLLYGDMKSPGSKLAIKLCRKHKKPYLENPTPIQIRMFIDDERIEILNIGGNRESTLTPENRDFHEDCMNGFFSMIGYYHKID